MAIGAALLVASVIAACDATGATSPAETAEPTAAVGLDGTTWVFSTVGGVQLPADPPATLKVAFDGSVSGGTGCNQFNGTASVDDLRWPSARSRRRAWPARRR